MTSKELRKIFLDFFKNKNHKIVPSSSLIPQDETVLFTTAGMQQFSLYLAGKKDPIKDFGTRNLASCQKCFRTDDIENVGDNTHHTFFEMLGNWSIGEDGGYFKEGAIKYALEFLVDILKLEKEKIWVTIFKGEGKIEKDEASRSIWKNFGIPENRIKECGMEDNFWGPTAVTGPCGPCSEIHYQRDDGRLVEIWNLVFMEYFKNFNGDFEKLPQKNVDTGIGFERLVSIMQNKQSAYETDLFLPIIKDMEKNSITNYQSQTKNYRIIADHIRAAVFLITDGILPSNLGRGYILRRILRRAVRYAKLIGMDSNYLSSLSLTVIKNYKDVYPELNSCQTDIVTVIQGEVEKFKKTLEKGLGQLEKLIENKSKNQENKIISGQEAFDLYQSYGFPIELTEELARERGFFVDKKGFENEFKKHQEVSRASAEKKFGGIGKEKEYYQAIKLHTATHLLQAALRKILGDQIKQMGSDITKERLRFDFSYPRALTKEEIIKVEDLVNKKINENLKVKKEETTYQQAISSGALAFFKEKYPEKVSVYTIFNPKSGEVFSKEVCAGPHVEWTKELGQFKIIKQENIGSGKRRIKAVLN